MKENYISISNIVMSSEDGEGNGGVGGQTLAEKVKPELKRPSQYRVVLINDDFTPMEFVVEILQLFFGMNNEKATQVMLTVHTQGKGVCGVYTKDIAETKAAMVNDYAEQHEHPLLCQVERIS